MAERTNPPLPKAPPPEDKPEAPETAAAPATKAPALSLKSLLPLAVVLVAAPALTWAVAQFLLLPRLEARLAAAAAPDAAVTADAPATAQAQSKKEGEASPATTYEFSNVVVNLAGTMGTRYLKTSFIVTGTDTKLRDAFETNKAKLVDVTLNVLSSLTLADLEEAGAKNVIREKLVVAYNQALGHTIAEQIYFSDFVVQ